MANIEAAGRDPATLARAGILTRDTPAAPVTSVCLAQAALFRLITGKSLTATRRWAWCPGQ